MDDSQRIRLLITGYRVSQAVHAAGVLELSDFFAGEPLSVVDLAAAAGCDPRSLHKVRTGENAFSSVHGQTKVHERTTPNLTTRGRSRQFDVPGLTACVQGRAGLETNTGTPGVNLRQPRATATYQDR